MKLKLLIEDTERLKGLANKTMVPTKQERAVATQALQTKELDKQVKKARSKEFKMNFKDDKGYYKIKIKSTDKGVKYSYGYYDRGSMPDVSLSDLTDDGKKKYEEFKNYKSMLGKGNATDKNQRKPANKKE